MTRRTAFGALAAGAGVAGFALALWTGSLAPALAGLVLFAGAAEARRSARSVPVRVERRLPERARLGGTFRVVTTAESPHRLPLRVVDEEPPGVRVTGATRRSGRGQARHERDLEPMSSGTLAWHRARVTTTDPWGLWEVERRVGAPGSVLVSPEGAWVAAGLRVGRRHVVDTLRRSRTAHEPMPEVERVREHEPGDRARDIDWARSSRSPEMWTRERERAAPRPMLILLDATDTMRRADGTPKLATAARFVTAAAAAGRAAGVKVHMVAFSEAGMVETRSQSGGVRQTLERLAGLPEAHAGAPLLAQVEAGLRSATDAERRFLRSLGGLGGGVAEPVHAALAAVTRRSGDPASLLAVLDWEAQPVRSRMILRRLRRHGHHVMVAAPATGPHHARRSALDEATERAVVEAFRRRAAGAREAAELGARWLSLAPGSEEEALQEVAKWAR